MKKFKIANAILDVIVRCEEAGIFNPLLSTKKPFKTKF